MGASSTLSAIADAVAAMEYASGSLYFEAVELWDADAPDAQLSTLQDADGRFALVLHDQTRYSTETRGRVQVSLAEMQIAILISNPEWAGAAPAAGLPSALDTAEAVASHFSGRSLPDALETLRVDIIERFRPEPEAGRVASRIVYRVGLTSKVRAPWLRSLTR